ncbi:MAG: fimbria major subunit [Tannerellaceae bacterium]|nr:fimbria major subunit [Tannerellaceae bacterium]
MADATNGTFYRIWIPLYTSSVTGEAAGNRYNGFYYTSEPTEVNLEEYISSKKATMGWPEDIKLVVDTYTGGICYYRLPLYNRNTNASSAPYTVKRNTYYMIDVETVSDAGYPDENGGGDGDGGNKVDPEEPLEPQSEIEVNIKVADWEEVKQGGNL